MTMPVVTDLPGEGRVRGAITRLRDVSRFHALRLAYDVGQIVCEALFDGDVEAFAKRSSEPWMRALAEHPELPFSAVVLSRSCSVFELMQRLGVGVEDTPLTLSHFRAVLVLGTASPNLQLELLGEAREQGWTAEDLASRVAALNPPRTRGRRPQHAVKKAVAALGRLVDGRLQPLTADDESLHGLGTEEIPFILRAISGAEQEIQQLRARLEQVLAGPGGRAGAAAPSAAPVEKS